MGRVMQVSLAVFFVVYFTVCVEACPKRPGDDFDGKELKDDHYYVYWKAVDDNTRIQVITCVRTDGWYGFGFSQTASMVDSDLVIGWYDNDRGQPETQSAFVGGTRQRPTARAGVWDHEKTERADGWIRTVFFRDIAATGTQGVPVKFGDNTVIWAYRNGAITDYGEVKKHENNKRGTNTINVKRSSATRPSFGLGVLVVMTALGLWRF